MKNRCILIVCLALLILNGKSSYACGFSPNPYFHMPSYIDPDYVVPRYSEGFYYGRNLTFEIILRQYITQTYSTNTPDDTHAREISQQTEPDNYTHYQEGAEYFRAFDYNNALKIFSELKNL